jgi:hypothetical protein
MDVLMARRFNYLTNTHYRLHSFMSRVEACSSRWPRHIWTAIVGLSPRTHFCRVSRSFSDSSRLSASTTYINCGSLLRRQHTILANTVSTGGNQSTDGNQSCKRLCKIPIPFRTVLILVLSRNRGFSCECRTAN